VVNRGDIPVRFFIDERRSGGGIRLTTYITRFDGVAQKKIQKALDNPDRTRSFPDFPRVQARIELLGKSEDLRKVRQFVESFEQNGRKLGRPLALQLVTRWS